MMTTKEEEYQKIGQLLSGLVEGEEDWLANTANFSALLFQHLYNLNWAGFYFLRGGELVLGPFQGKVACIRIPLGRGVCGKAAVTKKTLVVPDVHEFPGHIACDPDSNSEIVIPLIKEGKFLGVLDIDSPAFSRFDEEDRAGLENLVALLLESTDFSGIQDCASEIR